MIGETISHYRITKQLGAGGMGVVYEAIDLKLDRPVALKFLSPGMVADADAKTRFIHEAKATSALDHPNILTLHEIDETADGRLFLVTSRYEGETLRERLARGPMAVDEAVDIARQVAEGLAKAHDREIVHRDIKPANIFLTTDGIVKILDFGLAKLADRTVLTRDGTAMGTAKYMAPEQARGEAVDHRTDLWCLGAVLYEMLTGQVPYPGDYEQAIIYAILNTEPKPVGELRAGLAPNLIACVERCLAKDPDGRPRDARSLIAELAGDAGASRHNWVVALRPTLVLRIAAVVALVSVAVFVVGRFGSGGTTSQDSALIVAEMENRTAEPDLAPALREALVIGLQQSRHVKIVTGQALAAALGRMGRTAGDTLSADAACELALREGVPAVLATSLDDAGGSYQLVAQLLDPETCEPRYSRMLRAADQDELIPRLDQLVRDVRENLGESPEAISSGSLALAQVTTPSLEALRFYSMSRREADKERAATLLRQAVAADSTFAMAHARLSRTLMYSAKTQEALVHGRKAFDLRTKLPIRERLYVEGEYYRFQAQYEKAIASMTALLELDPEDMECRNNLIHTYMFVLKYRKALAQFDLLNDERRTGFYGHHTRGLLLGGAGDFAAASTEFRTAIRLADGAALATRMCLAAALISGLRPEEGQAQLDSLVILDADETVGAEFLVGRTLPIQGRFAEAITHLQTARGNALAVNDSSRAAWSDVYTGMCLSAQRDHEAAVRVLRRAVEFWPGDVPYSYLGAELAAVGDTAAAREFLEKLRAMAESDPTTKYRRTYTKLSGALAFHRGDLEAAVEILAANPLDLDARLMLGKAYAALGDLPTARAHFGFVVANQYHAFIEGLITTGSVAYYYLGVLEQTAGDPEAAAVNLSHFLDLWSAADPGIAEVDDARLRLQQLSAGLH